MPLITVKSLPFAGDFLYSQAALALCNDVSEQTGTSPGCLNVVWELIPIGQHVAGGQAYQWQEATAPPLIVQLLTGGALSGTELKRFYAAIAASLQRHTGVHSSNIFIYQSTVGAGGIHEGARS